jgi:sigma-B regulation protein RsbU (phosphoserine phosphatase)
MKIMVVDDALDTRVYLGALFRQWGHEVVEASNGSEALEHLADNDLRLVVSDWMMPEMDGIDLCRAIRQSSNERYVYVILLTGKTAREDLVHGLNAGADDFLGKPLDAQVLLARTQVAERIVGLETRLVKQNQELMAASQDLSSAYQRIQADLTSAARIQEQLLPRSTVTAQPLNTAWLFSPAATVAGDIFNFFDLGEGYLGFYHLDISGHGIPAAMLSVSLCKMLSPYHTHNNNCSRVEPATVVSDINRQLVDPDRECEQFVTLVYGTINRHSGKGRLCIAGHPPPFTVRPDGEIKRMKPGGLPAGMFADAGYSDMPFQLRPGERLVLYSDGITDCINEQNKPFGLERLQEVLADTASGPLKSLTETLQHRLGDWRGTAAAEDDISMLVLERPQA